jgi:hypothetical protein
MVALDNLGTADERRREFNEMARILNTAEFDMTCRRMTDHARVLLPDDASEDAVDAVAMDLTRPALQRHG